MDKKYAIIIGIILAVFLISSSYALLTNDNADSTTKNTNNVTKDTNITADKSVSVDNNSTDKSVAVDKSIDADKSVGLKSVMEDITPNSNIVSENPPTDRIYRENGTLFFEGYGGNGNRFFSEMQDLPNEHHPVDGDFVNPDNSEEKLDPADNPVMKNKGDIYNQLKLTPETMVYI